MGKRPMRVVNICIGLGFMASALAGCAGNPPPDDAADTDGSTSMSAPTDTSDPRAVDAQSEEQWAYSVGVQNYVFGLPLTIFERERSLRLDPVALEKAKQYRPGGADQPDRPHENPCHR